MIESTLQIDDVGVVPGLLLLLLVVQGTCFIGVTQLPCFMLHRSDPTPLLHASLE